MKIRNFTVTVILSIILVGCSIHNPKHRTMFVVTTIGITKNVNMAIYTAREYPPANFKDKRVQFFDEKHRYEVGDTIQFTHR